MIERPEPARGDVSPLAENPEFMRGLAQAGLPPEIVTREGFQKFISEHPQMGEFVAQVVQHLQQQAPEQHAPQPEAAPAAPQGQPGFAEGGLLGPLPPEAGDLRDMDPYWRNYAPDRPELRPSGGEESGLPSWAPNVHLGSQGLAGSTRGNVAYGGINGRVPLGDNAALTGGYSAQSAHVGGHSTVRDRVALGAEVGPVSGEISRSRSPSANGFDTPAGRRIMGNLRADLGEDDLGGQYSAEFAKTHEGSRGTLRYNLRFADGGFMSSPETEVEQAGGQIEPVPPGSLPEEVADDVDAKLSPGELVIPADVVRWHGLKTFEDMRAEAKERLAAMQGEGRIQAPGGLMSPPERDKPTVDADPEAPEFPFEEGGEPEHLGFAAGGLVTAPYQDQFGRGVFTPTTPSPTVPGAPATPAADPSLGVTTTQAPTTALPTTTAAATTPAPTATNNDPASSGTASWVAPAAAAAIGAAGVGVAGAAAINNPVDTSPGIGTLGNMGLSQAFKTGFGSLASATPGEAAAGLGTGAASTGSLGSDIAGVGTAIGDAASSGASSLSSWASGVADNIGNFASGITTAPGSTLASLGAGAVSTLATAGAGMAGGYLGNLAGTAVFGAGDPQERVVSSGIGAAGGAAAGAYIGSAFPVVGTVIGAFIGALVGAFGGAGFGGTPDVPYSAVTFGHNATETGTNLSTSDGVGMNGGKGQTAQSYGGALNNYMMQRAAADGYVLNNATVNQPTFFAGQYKGDYYYRPVWDSGSGNAVNPENASAYNHDPKAIADLAYQDSVAHGLFVRPEQQTDWQTVRSYLEQKAANDHGWDSGPAGESGAGGQHFDGLAWNAQTYDTPQQLAQRAAEQAQRDQLDADRVNSGSGNSG